MSRIFGIHNYQANLLSYDIKNVELPQNSDLGKIQKIEKNQSVFWHQGNNRNDNNSFGCDSSCILSIDGEIFNSHELEFSEEKLYSQLIKLILKHGIVKALNLFNGDFAIAFYQVSTNRLILARDRVGSRPLYYRSTDEYTIYGSLPRAIDSLVGKKSHPNEKFIALYASSHYRTFDNDWNSSPYAGIQQIPAGHYFESINNLGNSIHQYWKLKRKEYKVDSFEDLAREYRDLILSSVNLRFNKAYRPAFLLSGGMDSSTILASASYLSASPQVAFSSVYSDKTFDESEDIQSMLSGPVSKWNPIKIEVDDIFQEIENLVRIHQEPIATATWLSHNIVLKSISDSGHGSVFGGLGGDELNAGEYEYFYFFFADFLQQGEKQKLEEEVQHWINYHDHPIHKKSMERALEYIQIVTDSKSPGKCLPDFSRIFRYKNTLNKSFFDLETFSPIMDSPFSSYLLNRTFQDIFRETAPCCLRAEDRHAKAFGLDHIDPFFDYRLIEFMFQISGKFKISKGVTKTLLREAMKGILPEETRTRIKKTGWNAPAHVWFSGDTLQKLKLMVQSRDFHAKEIYDIKEVVRLIIEHEEITNNNLSRENHMMFLWQLLNLEMWLRTF